MSVMLLLYGRIVKSEKSQPAVSESTAPLLSTRFVPAGRGVSKVSSRDSSLFVAREVDGRDGEEAGIAVGEGAHLTCVPAVVVTRS